MLHNHSLVSAPCHMIAVMTDDGLTRRNVCVAMVELRWNSEHSKSSTTMRVQFNEVISYAAKKLEIECFKQTPMVSCAGNRESDVFIRKSTPLSLTAFQKCHSPFYKHSCVLAWPQTRHLYMRGWSCSVHGASLANVTFCHMQKWCNLIDATLFPATAFNGFDHKCHQALSQSRS